MKTIRRIRVPELLDVIGRTPVIRLRTPTRAGEAELTVKLESANSAGSLKDRRAWYVIDDAERTGHSSSGIPPSCSR